MDRPVYRHSADSFSVLVDDHDIVKRIFVSMISILPDELLERIFSYLPTGSIFRASSVCKKWHGIITSDRFLFNLSHIVSQKPWYFMLPCSNELSGYAYDPSLQKWHNIDLPRIQRTYGFIVSSYGLVSFRDKDPGNGIYVCNPITRRWRNLSEPPGLCYDKFHSCCHRALALSVEKPPRNHYYVTIVDGKLVPKNFQQCDVSVHLYDSRTMNWTISAREVLTGWRAEAESVICNETLYFLVHSTRNDRPLENRHGLISCNISSSRPVVSSRGILMSSLIPIPFHMTCWKLMNLNHKLVMVAGMAEDDARCRIKGIIIWVLKGKDWEEITRLPHRYFDSFRKLDHVFASNGLEDLVYVQRYWSMAVLMFDMKHKRWKYVKNCPVMSMSHHGFCFEPRLEIVP